MLRYIFQVTVSRKRVQEVRTNMDENHYSNVFYPGEDFWSRADDLYGDNRSNLDEALSGYPDEERQALIETYSLEELEELIDHDQPNSGVIPGP